MDDDKLWKLISKKDSIFQTTHFSSSSSKPILTRSFSTKPPSSSSSSEPIFRRSFSAKPIHSKSPILSRNCSTKCQAESSSSKSVSISRSLSQKGASVTQKCRKIAKEHKSRFYIIKRCVSMLVCWHKHA